MPASTGIGALGTTGYALETTYQTYVNPTNWLFWESNNIVAKPDVMRKSTATGTVVAERTIRATKFQVMGALGLSVYATHGARLWKAALGSDAYVTALAADTVKTATTVTTSNGSSSITLTNTGAANYSANAWVKVGTGTTSEMRQISSITGNGAAGTIITVPALVTNASAAAGTAVQQVGQHHFTQAITSATLPSLSLENQESTQFSWKLAGVLVDKWNYKITGDQIEQSYDVFGTVMPVKLATPTTPTPSANEVSDLTHPFTNQDTTLAAIGDFYATGSASAQPITAAYLESADINLVNNIVKKKYWDGKQVYQAFRGPTKSTIKYKITNSSKRAAEFEDYLSQYANQTVPFLCGSAINTAATGADNWIAVGVACSAATMVNYTPGRAIADTITAEIELETVPATYSASPLEMWVVNADTAGY